MKKTRAWTARKCALHKPVASTVQLHAVLGRHTDRITCVFECSIAKKRVQQLAMHSVMQPFSPNSYQGNLALSGVDCYTVVTAMFSLATVFNKQTQLCSTSKGNWLHILIHVASSGAHRALLRHLSK